MDIVHSIHDQNVTKVRKALVLAAAIIENEIRSLIENYCHPETKTRLGSIKSSVTPHWFNEDTIDEPGIVKELKHLRSVQTKVQDALEAVTF